MSSSQLSKIKNISLLANFSDEVLEDFSRICIARSFAAAESIYLPGEDQGKVYLILSGEVRIYRSSQGRKVVIQVLKRGDFFGDLSIAHGEEAVKSDNTAQAVTEAEICVISSSDLKKFLNTHPMFALVLLTTLRDRLHQAEGKIRDLAISSAQTRLLNELIRHAQNHGEPSKRGYVIEEKLTHQNLAEMVGVTRETVTKTLQKLEDEGFVAYTPNRRIELIREEITNKCVPCIELSEADVK